MINRNSQRGFTLIELVVVMAITSVLTAIAIPQYKQYRAKSFDAGARADLHNAVLAEEAYFVDNDSYRSCANSACPATLPGMHELTVGVQISMTGTTSGFLGTASHRAGVRVYSWNSANGGLQP